MPCFCILARELLVTHEAFDDCTMDLATTEQVFTEESVFEYQLYFPILPFSDYWPYPEDVHSGLSLAHSFTHGSCSCEVWSVPTIQTDPSHTVWSMDGRLSDCTTRIRIFLESRYCTSYRPRAVLRR
jgi:hypothetical protein